MDTSKLDGQYAPWARNKAHAKAQRRKGGLLCGKLLTYLRIANRRLGLSMKFNAEFIKDGISRVVNNPPE
jgi:hypothetical protein